MPCAYDGWSVSDDGGDRAARLVDVGEFDYQVLALGQNYDYAMVGSPDRSYLWVLSRTPTIDPQAYRALVAEAGAQGFQVSALVETPHSTR